ncbi:MAG: hypothetical protein IKO72_15210 [Kiritimatiellae bacterium]|nr:hypothetical protein [Kiritimatiellia bacterium]
MGQRPAYNEGEIAYPENDRIADFGRICSKLQLLPLPTFRMEHLSGRMTKLLEKRPQKRNLPPRPD